MSENTELEVMQISGNDIAFLQEKAQVDVQISTAKAFPRNLKRSLENAIVTATIDRETASTCTYSVPRGGKSITGPSVHLAKILAQCWGNMRIEAKVIEVGDKHVTSQAVAFDLENNVAIKVEVKRSIMTRSGRMNDDMIVVTGNAGNSIALRNAILSVIPKAVTDKVYNSAKQTITGDISDATKLLKRRKQVMDGLMSTYTLTEKEVLSAIGKAAVDHITPDDLVVLIGIGQAIKDGDTSVDTAFKGKKDETVTKTAEQIEIERMSVLINDADSVEDLAKIEKDVQPELIDLFNQKKDGFK